jgi:hypothetical protein
MGLKASRLSPGFRPGFPPRVSLGLPGFVPGVTVYWTASPLMESVSAFAATM